MNPGSTATATLYETYVNTQIGTLHRADTDEFESYARHYRKCLLPHLPASRGARILDLGCGMGHLLYFLEQEGFRNYLGIDIGAQQIACCRNAVTGRVELVDDSAEYLRANTGAFDAIVCIDVLEHLDDEPLFDLARAAHTALRPGGRMIVGVPNAACVTTLMTRYSDLTHRRLLTEISLRQLFLNSGFDQIELHPLEKRVVRSFRHRGAFWAWRIRERLVRWLLLELYQQLMEGAVPEILTVNILGVATRTADEPAQSHL